MTWLMVMVLGVAAACGPSNAEIKTAKSARYTATPSTLFDIAVQVVERDYKLGDVDHQGARFTTAPQMYTAEGSRQSPGADGYVGRLYNVDKGSILLLLVVEVLEAERRNIVVVTPKTFQFIEGSPKPRELAPHDPNVPGWVHGRVDALAVAIYEAAKQHAAP